MDALFDRVIQKVITFVQTLWNQIFGGWNYINIFYWLPQDIRNAATLIVLTLFVFALWKLLMQLLPH